MRLSRFFSSGRVATLGLALVLAMPLSATAQDYGNPVIVPPPDDQHDSDRGSNYEPPVPDVPDVPVDQGVLKDATGSVVEVTRGSKSLQFQSARNRQGTGIQYQSAIDSAEGGGANGGFPMWEGNGDWTVRESAYCEVAGRNDMNKVDGVKEQTFSCYLDWMSGEKEYVDLAHCEAGANNTKYDATIETIDRDSTRGPELITSEDTISYSPPSCPHPEWIIGGWSSWKNTSGWYRASWDSGKTCGTVTEQINQKRTRSLSCKNGTMAECETYNGPVRTTETRKSSRSRNLGSCLPYFVIRYHLTLHNNNSRNWHSAPRCIANCAGVNAGHAGAYSSRGSWTLKWKHHGSWIMTPQANHGSRYLSSSTVYIHADIRIPNQYK